MKTRLLPFILMTLLLLNCKQVSAQQFYDSLLNVYATRYPQEKIHLHLDKNYYSPGETIWFKGYITEKNIPSAISKTLYADLLNADGQVLQRKTMPILQSGAASFFELDTAYHSPLYIRAYTSWMLNFDSSLLYLKPITLLNTKQAAKKTAASVFTLSIFPEGGDLIENINSRVAFKTNNEKGEPFKISGSIVSNKGRAVCSFTSVHNGMGIFSFTPLPNETYKAIWKNPAGQTQETELPQIRLQGIALRITKAPGKLVHTLNRPEVVDEAFTNCMIIAQMHQQTMYAAKVNMQNKTQLTVDIPSDSLPDGVLQITVFNALKIPVAERLIFINNNTYYFLTDLHAPLKNLTPRGKNVLQLDVGENLLSNLSISVTDAGLDDAGNNRENIFTELLLGSDLKGNIYNPAYYFSSDADSVAQHLDLVMMTNGWRRLKWQDAISGKWPQIKYAPDNYISLKGSVFGLTKTQLKDKSLSVISKTSNSGNSFFTIDLSPEGTFALNGMYFFDTAKLYYQFNNDKDKRLTSAASYNFTTGFEKAPNASANLLASIGVKILPAAALLDKNNKQTNLFLSSIRMEKTKTLQTIVVQGKQKSAKEKLDEQYATGLFSGGFGRVFAVEDDPTAQSAISILDYLRGRVPGLQISTQGDGSVTRRGSNTDVFLNEMNTDITMLQSTPMSDVAMIKVFDPPFFGATGGGAGGAIAVYTKKGGSNAANVKGLNEVKLVGYSTLREFYMPNYETNNSDAGDYRTTLYWNPFVLMDAKNRRVTIPIFNSDNCKKMKVVIEGINENGQLTREEKIFE